jgi:DNA-binding transcriptional LysR family regulator
VDLRLDQLRTFTCVAAAGSMTRAARELNYAQSTVSLHISTLEKRVGAALFVRRADGLVLTLVGERLLTLAVKTISLVELMKLVGD